MKKILALSFMLMLSATVAAGDKNTEKNKVKPTVSAPVENTPPPPTMAVKTTTACIGGYVFAVATQTSSTGSSSISIEQIMTRNANHLPPQPMTC